MAKPTHNAGSDNPAERAWYLGIADINIVLYLFFFAAYQFMPASIARTGILSQQYWFGWTQLAPSGPTGLLFIGLVFALFLWVIYRRHPHFLTIVSGINERSRDYRVLLIISICSIIVFFLLNNNFVNPDGQSFPAKFAADVPIKGAHVTHDEMLELYVHSRFWFYTEKYFGWSVWLSYRVLSALAGGVFVFILVKLCQLEYPSNPLSLFAAIASAGFMELYFGEVENYTLTSDFILLYFYLAPLYLKNKCSIVLPAVVLGTAILFHFLACFLIPAFVFLSTVKSQGKLRADTAIGLSIIGIMVGASLVFFHFHNLPLSDLFYHTHAFGHGGHIWRQLAKPSPLDVWQQINLLMLLLPCAPILFPLVFYHRISSDPHTKHLLIATICMLAFHFGWRAKLGAYNDWNLYANVAIPLSILIWTNWLQNISLKSKKELFLLLVLPACAHSYSWIISNHFVVTS